VVCFFFSYASADKNPYLDRFYAELVDEVRGRSGLPVEEVAFRDETGLEPGKNWPDELEKALAQCRVFVYLHSPTYFGRPYCGKEFQIFKNRVETHLGSFRGVDGQPSMIQPIHWIPTADLSQTVPKEVCDLQYTHGDYGDDYKNQGLRYLIQTEIRTYEKVKTELAKRIWAAASLDLLPEAKLIIPLDQVESLFPMKQPIQTSRSENENNRNTYGPRYAQFLFVAGHPDELKQTSRKNLTPYGENGGEDWMPYMESLNEDIAAIAQRAIVETGLRYECVRCAKDFDQLRITLERAEETCKIMIVIIDIWTLQLGDYNNVMKQYDRVSFYNCVPIAPWNFEDMESKSNYARLKNLLELTFPAKVDGRGFTDLRMEINSLEQLQEEIIDALSRTRAKILRTAATRMISDDVMPIISAQ